MKKYIAIIIVVLFTGCRKLIQTNPPINAITTTNVYNSNANAASVITGIYTAMSTGDIISGRGSMSMRTGLSADELVPVTDPLSILTILYKNNLTNEGEQLFWPTLYTWIFRIHAAMDGISASGNVTPDVKRQLIAEAKFIRAYCYYYLVSYYGDVPLILNTDAEGNRLASRTDKAVVYEQIVSDLKAAQTELSADYLKGDARTPATERVRPNQAVATALLARVYLSTGKWAEAEQEATKLIDNPAYELETLANTFLNSSRETIWAIQMTDGNGINYDADSYVLASGPSTDGGPSDPFRPVYMSPRLFNAFEPGDQRRLVWVDSVKLTVSGHEIVYPYPYKYKSWQLTHPSTENQVIFRLAEQYLIRAEARAHLNKLTGANSAQSDINEVRQRAGLGGTPAASQAQLLDAVLKERQVELFTEGHRWIDLQRMNKIDQVMTEAAASKNSTWESYKALYPIPITDIQLSPNLKGHQNAGYPEN